MSLLKFLKHFIYAFALLDKFRTVTSETKMSVRKIDFSSKKKKKNVFK